MSGTRKPPPISTSSPREMITSRPVRQRRQHQQGRGGIVVDDHRGLGAGQRGDQRLGVHGARSARARGEVVLRDSCSRRRCRQIRARAAGDSGARPRLVCMTTPVALITGRSEPCDACASRARGVGLDRRRQVRGTASRPTQPWRRTSAASRRASLVAAAPKAARGRHRLPLSTGRSTADRAARPSRPDRIRTHPHRSASVRTVRPVRTCRIWRAV